ncbi:tRNA pseudouridine synthase-like 1 isoform X1 [Pieris rapae]|uniref:tRNA pseudouridine synthase-like 1 isoform X1 n=2 Tax=Pieris rapae TaxID=64459 RepID=UPI001E2818CC|nr:tRNA pseudouridine synthase-like 1 isoform X1 [Pieris rapae]
MKARYLLYFSYIGTTFRSSEKLWMKMGRNYPDPESVQGIMEIALLKFKSENYPAVNLSSRTDGGVHALNTSAHIDLVLRSGTKLYHQDSIPYELNKFFLKRDISIFVKKAIRVNDHFSARRNAISRTYLYRFAVLREGLSEKESIGQYIPIEEWKRCLFIRPKQFDIEKFKEAAKYFEGYHDFTTFKKFDKLKQHKHNRRYIYSINVRPGQPIVTSYTNTQTRYFDYWDVEIKGHSFVHNQIRRMVGSLITVASGKIEPKDIKLMLQIPSKHSWISQIASIPANGLYLCNVEYKPEDLIYNAVNDNKIVTEN